MHIDTQKNSFLTFSILCHEATTMLAGTISDLLQHDWIDTIQLVDTSRTGTCKNLVTSDRQKKISYIHIPTDTETFDFSKVRNTALQKNTSEWTFFLDSDERLDTTAFTSLHRFITTSKTSASFAGATIQRVDFFHGKKLRFGETGTCRLLRLVRTRSACFTRQVHEVLLINDSQVKAKKIYPLAGSIEHYSHKSLAAFITSVAWYASLESQKRTWNHWTLLELLVYPPAKFFVNFIVKQGFRDGYAGLCYAIVMSLHSLLVRVFTYENHSQKNQGNYVAKT